MKTKQQLKDEALETYKEIKDTVWKAKEKITDLAYQAYNARIEEIDNQS